jgi:hypothetical protein
MFLQFLLLVMLFHLLSKFCTSHQHFPQCPIGLFFLHFLNFVLSWYIAQLLSEGSWDGSNCPYCYWYHFCFYTPHALNFYCKFSFLYFRYYYYNLQQAYFNWSVRYNFVLCFVRCVICLYVDVTCVDYYYYLLLLLLLLTAVEFSPGGSRIYTSTDKANKHKLYINETIQNTVQAIQNTVQTIQYRVNASTHITKTPTQLPKHPHLTKQVKTTTLQDTPKWKSHNTIKYTQYKVTLTYMVLSSPRTSP